MSMYKKVRSGIYSLKSFLVHGRYMTKRWDYDHHVVPPLSSSSTFRLSSAERGARGFQEFAQPGGMDFQKPPIYIYERLDEPTRNMLEDRLACAEGGEIGVCFTSGMAAVWASLGILAGAGDEILCHQTVYGCTYSLLTNWLGRLGVETKFLDMTDPGSIDRAITPKTRIVFFETPVNPTLELIDIGGVCNRVQIANAKRGEDEQIQVVIDNTFATPVCQRPLEFGVDLVVHSLTKNICGFGTDIGGAVVTRKEFEGDLLMHRKDFGSPLSSKNAWNILVFGLPSLALRMQKETESAGEVARFLEGHPLVERVSYPGLPSHPQHELARRQMLDFDGDFAPANMVYFTFKGDGESSGARAEKFVDILAHDAYTLTLAVSLGQIRTLVETPGAMTHAPLDPEARSRANIEAGGVRLSVGIEEVSDIIKDLESAFKGLK
jgi:cystathionine beta-lyase/cystathionine gamma-synthase